MAGACADPGNAQLIATAVARAITALPDTKSPSLLPLLSPNLLPHRHTSLMFNRAMWYGLTVRKVVASHGLKPSGGGKA